MAIDLLENSELSALAPNRLGNKCFVDDGEEYANFSIVSKKEKARRKEASIQGVNQNWGIDPSKANDCDYLQTRLSQLSSFIATEVSKNPSKTATDRFINPLKDVENQYKSKVISLKCTEKKLQQEKETEQKRNLEVLTKVTDTPLGAILPEDVSSAPKTNITKYVLIGVGGLVLVITAIALLRRRN